MLPELRRLDDSRLIAWLAEASLHARNSSSVPVRDLVDSPNLFPFRIKSIPAEGLVVASSRLDVIRYGLDDYCIILRKSPNGGSRTG